MKKNFIILLDYHIPFKAYYLNDFIFHYPDEAQKHLDLKFTIKAVHFI